MHKGWSPKASTPQTSITLKETERSGSLITYRLYAIGLPRDQHYSLVSWPVTQREPGVLLSGVTVDGSGLAICAGKPGDCGLPDKPDDPIDLKINPVKGEPFRVALISPDGKTKAFAKAVPIPNQATDGGCSLQATLLLPGAVEVAIEGSGFAPNADLTLETNSSGERQSKKAKADSDGTYYSAILPYKQGESRGTAEVKIKSSSCSPAVSFDWGASARLLNLGGLIPGEEFIFHRRDRWRKTWILREVAHLLGICLQVV